MFKNDATFWLGIILLIFGLNGINAVKEKTLTCSKTTYKCSVETRNFFGYAENIKSVDFKTAPKIGFVLTKMNILTERKVRNYNTNFHRNHDYTEYCHSYDPVFITHNDSVVIANDYRVCTNYHVSPDSPNLIKKVYQQIYNDKDYTDLIEQFSSFINSPNSSEFYYQSPYEDKDASFFIKFMVCFIVGFGSLLLYNNAKSNRSDL